MKTVAFLIIVFFYSQLAYGQFLNDKKEYFKIEDYSTAILQMDSIINSISNFISNDMEVNPFLIDGIDNNTEVKVDFFSLLFISKQADSIILNLNSSESNIKFLIFLIKNKHNPIKQIDQVNVNYCLCYGNNQSVLINYAINPCNCSYCIVNKLIKLNSCGCSTPPDKPRL
jgi:hypothetical protein